MLKTVYYLVITRTFDMMPVKFETYPTTEEIEESIRKHEGTSARVEERYELQ